MRSGCPAPRSAALAALAVLALAHGPAAGAEEVVEITPRPGVTLRMLVESPANARAVALLLPGGQGRVLIREDGRYGGLKGNFLIRSRDRFVARGIATAVFDAPSDRLAVPGLTFAYRITAEHAGDIAAAVAALRARFPGVPVWLVGTSRGSISAANAASRPDAAGADGVVLTSSVGVDPGGGGNLLDLDLEAIAIPALVVHHRDDGCRLTPADGARAIRAALTRARRAELLLFDGGEAGEKPCQGRSHHGYLGIEDRVVDAIAGWIGGG